MITKVVSSVVAGMGHHAVEAADGDTALVTAETLSPDLVFLDLHMPQMSGLEVLEQMRAILGLQAVPVVLLTISRDPRVVTKAAKFVVKDYLSKPAHPSKIRDKVKKYLGRVGGPSWLSYAPVCTGRTWADRICANRIF
jgi:CheY-like chemotaxis protein